MSSGIGDVLQVGSVPFDTVEDVLETCAKSLGRHAYAFPGGEIGERTNWIQALPSLTGFSSATSSPVRSSSATSLPAG